MIKPFYTVYPITLSYEVGKVDDRADTGGRTCDGVTQKRLDKFCKDFGFEKYDVFNLRPEHREKIYEQYWDRAKCSKMPAKLGMAHFDCAFHSGVRQAGKILQRSIGMKGDSVDGIIGSFTLNRLNAVVESEGDPSLKQLMERAKFLAEVILTRYIKFYKKTPEEYQARQYSLRFARGWFGRLIKLARVTA